MAGQPDDFELARRYRDGDASAFTELVDRYRNLVYGVVYRMTRAPNEADDVAQEVFLRLHKGLPYFRGEAKFSTWLYRIVLSVVQERGARRRVRTVALESGPPDDPRPLDVGRADASFDALITRDRLEKALAQLSERSRFVLAAHYLQDVRYEDLAEALGVPLGTVKTLIHRAKRQLRDVLTSGVKS
ncbi:MAG: RNA polymerase sigma factor [Vicinamibacterales bacterium]